MSRSTNIGLGLGCIVLIVGLVGTLLYYNIQMSTLNNDKNVLTSYKNQLETWLTGNATQYETWLTGNATQYDNYVANHHRSDSEYDSLQRDYNRLRAPMLIGVLSTADNRPFLGSPSLHIWGNIVNVGADNANNALLYVEAFQGAVLTFNTTISLGTVNARSFATYVDSYIAYNGNPITKWHVWASFAGFDWTWNK